MSDFILLIPLHRWRFRVHLFIRSFVWKGTRIGKWGKSELAASEQMKASYGNAEKNKIQYILAENIAVCDKPSVCHF